MGKAKGDASTGGCDLLQTPDPTELPEFHDLTLVLSGVDLERVRGGDRQAGRLFITSWNIGCDKVWRSIHEECGADLRLKFPSRLAMQRLSWAAADAPFSALAESASSDEQGLALYLVDQLRDLVVGAAPVTHLLLDTNVLIHLADDDVIHVTNQLRYLAGSGTGLVIERIRTAFELTNRQLAELFEVTPTAVAQWLQTGTPASRQAKAVTVAETADILTYRLKPGHLPGVARKPAAAYGGRTMLEMIAADEHEELLASVRASFDYSRSA